MTYNPIAHKAQPSTTDDRLDAICERLDRLIVLLERSAVAAEWTARKAGQIRRQGS